jgi:hypothetical protein
MMTKKTLKRAQPKNKDIIIRININTAIILLMILCAIILFLLVPATGGFYWW